ncbi:MAG: host attachment protein [Gammaproteobacteria bacterium]
MTVGADCSLSLKFAKGFNMKYTRVIVAESSRARLFAFISKNEPLLEVDDMLNPAGRAHESELTSDLPGRAFGSTGSGTKHSLEPKTTPKEQAAIDFAKKIAEHIEKERTDGKLSSIILASSPKFLGILRRSLSDEALKLVDSSIDKNLVELSEAEIRQHLK